MEEETKDDGNKAPTFEVADALKLYEEFKNYWAENYEEARIDLKMALGDPATHWGNAYNARVNAKKLTMVINELPQFIHQVTNDIRQNTPSIKIIPDGDVDEETAKIRGDLIRGIEYKSAADEAYDTAADYAVKCSIGFIKVGHDFCDDDNEEQELSIDSVPDPLVIFNDPTSVTFDGRDARKQIALEPCSKDDFERDYKGKAYISFTNPKSKDIPDSIVLGNIYIRSYSGKRGKAVTVWHYKFSGEDLLAVTRFPGEYCPYVPVYGEMTWVDGKRVLQSLIRQARDPQLRLNHWACKEQEILNMAPIAPVMAEEGTLVNERGQWQSPGSEMVLEYRKNNLDGAPANVPTRLQPPPIPTGIINAMQGAKENIKESMGLYNASIGQRSNEVSGVAIDARKQEGDVATSHFPDNVRRSITQVGRICNSAINEIYDTPRFVQTVNEETVPKMIGINGMSTQGQEQHYDLTKGKGGVRVTTGTSYTTKRQEAAQLFGDVIKANPELMNVIGDLWAKNLDVAGADAMAARLERLIPPQLKDDQQQDPQVQQLSQELQKAQAEIQQLAAELQNKQGDQQLKQAEIAVKSKELDIKGAELQLKAQQIQGVVPEQADFELKANDQAFEHALKERELQLKEQEFQLKVEQAQHKIDMDAINTLQPVEETAGASTDAQ